MKCLAIYDWEPNLGADSLYALICKHLKGFSPSTENSKVVLRGWPRAKKISGNDLLTILTQSEQIKSVEIELVFSFENRQVLGMLLISSMPRMLFVGLPEEIEKDASFQNLVKKLVEKAMLGYGYVFHGDEGDEPALYASGITYVKAGKSIDRDTSATDARWFNELVLGTNGRRRYKDEGMMRGVYDLNVLNAHHIERIINGKDLYSLVRERGWGDMRRISENNWLWHITGQNRADAESYLRSFSVLI